MQTWTAPLSEYLYLYLLTELFRTTCNSHSQRFPGSLRDHGGLWILPLRGLQVRREEALDAAREGEVVLVADHAYVQLHVEGDAALHARFTLHLQGRSRSRKEASRPEYKTGWPVSWAKNESTTLLG